MIRNLILLFASLAVCLGANAQQDGVPLIAARDYLSGAEEKVQADLSALNKMRSRTDRFSNVRVSRFNPNAVHANVVTVVLPDGTERQYVATKIERVDFEANRLASVIPDQPQAPAMSASSSAPAEINIERPPEKPAYVQVAPLRSWVGRSKTGHLFFNVSDDGGFQGTIVEQSNRTEHYQLVLLSGGLIAVQRVVRQGIREPSPAQQEAFEERNRVRRDAPQHAGERQ